jgi:hypothetical protein
LVYRFLKKLIQYNYNQGYPKEGVGVVAKISKEGLREKSPQLYPQPFLEKIRVKKSQR